MGRAARDATNTDTGTNTGADTAAGFGTDVVAAGALVVRGGGEVLLVHRPKYDDWTFPKGKQDPGEHLCATAVREVLEETGVLVRLGRPLKAQRYRLADGRTKAVQYWVGRAIGEDGVEHYRANNEIDRLGWFPRARARKRLSYARDVELLDTLRPARTRTLLVLRHGHAAARARWTGPDGLRPLTGAGRRQARSLVPVLTAYGIDTVVSSDSTRCMQTVTPYAESQGLVVAGRAVLNEEQWTPTALAAVVQELLGRKRAVVCTHRPVLPGLLGELGLTVDALHTAELVVVHHRKGRILAVERHHVG